MLIFVQVFRNQRRPTPPPKRTHAAYATIAQCTEQMAVRFLHLETCVCACIVCLCTQGATTKKNTATTPTQNLGNHAHATISADFAAILIMPSSLSTDYLASTAAGPGAAASSWVGAICAAASHPLLVSFSSFGAASSTLACRSCFAIS